MTEGVLLIYRYKIPLSGPYYPTYSGAGEFSTPKKAADCASCTENAPVDKTEKIKKKIRSFFAKTLAKSTKM